MSEYLLRKCSYVQLLNSAVQKECKFECACEKTKQNKTEQHKIEVLFNNTPFMKKKIYFTFYKTNY